MVVEGLLGLRTSCVRDSYAVTVYLDPPEELRREWKIERDCLNRDEREQVIAELDRREPDSAEFVRPQRALADIVIRFGP